ncbi:saxitoxin and tetrodotoxin-binding protein 1-like isoform X2 [Cheilinus undulatus]|uniref:saxitoxin and tetrodotoxin-binding protein 1-like isoform X2 n=1 Tax=Cheilinus undulatus TaxID=241271 RepID=UPI001BD692E0|nr:saxitoxin and tetrodotoxin-binding protein 1-like isoform X2 [Cheilinus undulatus]
MSFVKQSLLLLLLAAVGTYTVTEDCDGLNRTLSATNFHKILPKDDSNTILFVERNKYISNVCANYNVTMKYPSEEHIVEVISTVMEQNGTVVHINDTAKAEFFETEENSLVMYYRGFLGRFLFIYRRDGHHVDFQVTKEAEADYHKLAGCVNLSLDNRANYKEAGDFCHKKYSPDRA